VAIRTEIQPLVHPDPYANAYNLAGFKLLPAIVEENPNYKNQVGEFIYYHVEKIATEQHAPKITGMIIELPIDEVKNCLYDYTFFLRRVNEAGIILTTP